MAVLAVFPAAVALGQTTPQGVGTALETQPESTEVPQAVPAGTDGPPPSPAQSATQPRPQSSVHDTGPPQDVVPRWLEAVRAQRQALQEDRRAQHQARRRALDPMGTARQEALEQAFQRRRQEMRAMIDQERRLFLNFGPWLNPLPSSPGISPPSLPPAQGAPAQSERPENTPPAPAYELPEWDNGWYFQGW